MQTIGFIGSDKNAGKTTVLNFVYKQLAPGSDAPPAVCLASTGINGEPVDAYEGHPKPEIALAASTLFVTAREHLPAAPNSFEVLERLEHVPFAKSYCVARCKEYFNVVLEGPNTRQEILAMKRRVSPHLPGGYLLLDGSVDRQFMAHPTVCDRFCFSILLSDRRPQVQKAKELLTPPSLPVCSDQARRKIEAVKDEHTKSLLFDRNLGVSYRGNAIPFLDDKLKESIGDTKHERATLYLNGALSPSLYRFLSPCSQLTMVLDNFTLFQTVSAGDEPAAPFRPALYLRYPVRVCGIFVRCETEDHPGLAEYPMPADVPVFDLFIREPDITELSM